MVTSDEDYDGGGKKIKKRPRPVSPPVIRRKKSKLQELYLRTQHDAIPAISAAVEEVEPTPASVEAGQVDIKDHLSFYSTYLSSHLRTNHSLALLSITAWQDLYIRNSLPQGHHFVIHQHDHPIAGTHYDLRLQINETSSCSWAIMYGLPGDPNSKRLNRNATETRVHCLWNHLVESGSSRTGSLLIWDTGEYQILDRIVEDGEDTDREDGSGREDLGLSENEKLARAFARGKIRIRLNGIRLPKGYVLYIRRPKDADLKDRKPSAMRRKRKASTAQLMFSDEEDAHRGHSDADDHEEDTWIRENNAYPGASNTIGSIHQRTWYASMDRTLSGFRKTKQNGETVWTRGKNGSGFEAFRVLGRDSERSIISGRLAKEVMTDEGVVGYTSRAGWRPILE